MITARARRNEPQLDPARVPKSEARPKLAPDFVCLPQAVLKSPPIRHRGAEQGLSALESCLVGALTVLARAELKQHRHAYALRTGKEYIKSFREKGKGHYANDVFSAPENFQAHGWEGYSRGVDKFNQRRSHPDYPVVASAKALLGLAGLSTNGKNQALVPAALRRLAQPIGKFPPVLRHFEKLRGGKFQLVVNSWWAPTKRFALVPWPPPTKGTSTTTLALYLFLFGADLRPESKINIALGRLYRQLGIPPAHAKRSLYLALACVNEHLAALKQPTFEMVSVESDRVRFVTAKAREAAKATPPIAAKSKGTRKAESGAGRQLAQRRQARLEAAQADKLEWGDQLDEEERERLHRRFADPDELCDDDELLRRERDDRWRRECDRREAECEANRALGRRWNEKFKAMSNRQN
jgi:hypothetical protein